MAEKANELNWGLIGASTIASSFMIDAIRSQSGRILGVMSGNAKHGSSFAGKYGIAKSTTGLSELLADPEIHAVYISSTNEKHFSQAMEAVAAGKHVLCEKPLAMSLADAVEMVREADRNGKVLATNHHLRNAGSHIAIRDLVTSGAIGEVLSVRVMHAVNLPKNLHGWRVDNEGAGGGVILDIAVHDADTVRFCLGEDPVEVMAISGVSGLGKGVEDSSMSVWSMPSGTMVQAHESFSHTHAETGFEVHGTKGSVIARGVMTQQPVGEVNLLRGAGREPVPFSGHNLYERSVSAFVSAVTGKGQPSADGIDGAKSLAVALAIMKSSAEGRRITVDYGGCEIGG